MVISRIIALVSRAGKGFLLEKAEAELQLVLGSLGPEGRFRAAEKSDAWPEANSLS